MADRVIIFDVRRASESLRARDVKQMCVCEDTRILVSDKNLYESAKTLSIGDRVFGVDENSLLSHGVIENIWKRKGSARKIEFHNGTVLTLSNHPLLTWDGLWVSSDKVSENDKIRTIQKAQGVKKGDCFYTKIKKIEEVKEVSLVNFQVNPIETFICEDIVTHNCGRAGRMHGQEEANVHIVLTNEDAVVWRKKFEEDSSYEVRSTLNNIETFAFHVISQVVRGNIEDKESFEFWYDRTLDKFQRIERKEPIPIYEDIAQELHETGSAEFNKDTGEIKPRPLGKICAAFYFSPYDVRDWFNNITILFKKDLLYNDVCQAWALSNVTSAKEWDSDILKRNTEELFEQVSSYGLKAKSGISARFLAVNSILNGKFPKMDLPCYYSVKNDLPRILTAINSMAQSCRRLWGNLDHFVEVLQIRQKHGVPSRFASLISLPGIGKTTARQLYEEFDIRNETQLLERIDIIRDSATAGIKRSLTRYLNEKRKPKEEKSRKKGKTKPQPRISRKINRGRDEFEG